VKDVDTLAIRWRKSSRSSMEENSDCVEIANLITVVAIRDSKDPTGPRLTLTRSQWNALSARLKDADRA
jgi:hypothetical protein